MLNPFIRVSGLSQALRTPRSFNLFKFLIVFSAIGHKIDPKEGSCAKFCGLYLNDTIGEKFPGDAYEMTVMLFKANTKSVDLPVRFSELVYFLVLPL